MKEYNKELMVRLIFYTRELDHLEKEHKKCQERIEEINKSEMEIMTDISNKGTIDDDMLTMTQLFSEEEKYIRNQKQEIKHAMLKLIPIKEKIIKELIFDYKNYNNPWNIEGSFETSYIECDENTIKKLLGE